MLTSRLPFSLLFAASLLPATALAQSSVQDFELGGSAYILNKDCIRLTRDTPRTSGSAWFKKPIDLAKPFEMKVDLVLGTKDLDGADGIGFVFHPTPQTGFGGEGMGFAGLIPAVGFEFDTYQNFHLDDPFEDHLALVRNGQTFHFGEASAVKLGNLEDGARHPLRIVWKPASKLQIYLDGSLRAAFPAEVVTSTFGENRIVYWGMTAATGRLSNAQDVCLEKLFIGV